MEVLAVDWSGDARAPARRIRVARARPGRLLAVDGGLDRHGVVDHLIAAAAAGPVVAGLDFSFGLPAWFARAHGCGDVSALWALAARAGERWLQEARPPFWGRAGTRRPPEDPTRPRWRRTESDARARGLRPSSTFQIGGAGSVGTGSLRGMPSLARLRDAGFSVWPFDDAGDATVLEIYPAAFTGGIVKSSEVARRAAVGSDARIPAALAEAAAATEDAFDAALSALAMAESVDVLRSLRAAPVGSPEALEGALWLPRA